MKGRPERIVFLTDTHVPYNINLIPVFKFVEDFHPDTIILGGDIHDFEAVSHWVADQSRHLGGKTVKRCFKQMRKVVLDPLKAAAPRARMVYLEGNHEDWLNKAIAANPNGKGFWEVKNNLDFKHYNMRFFKINVPYEASPHLYYIHGIYTNMYHARSTVQAFGKSVLYGHVHDVQEHTIISPIKVSHVTKGKSVGCLCSRSPSYLKNRPNRWVNGFNFAYVWDSGFFNEFQTNIIEGRFVANDKLYG